MEFVHLHVHSHYSLLDGLSKVPDLVERAKQQGATALALTDHGVMYGAIEFYQACKKAEIKPIIGNEIYVTQGSITDRELKRGEKNFYHLTLLAKDHEGYVNLMRLTTEAHLRGFYYRPRVDHDTLAKYAKGLVCLSGCLGGELAQTILHGNPEQVKQLALWHKNLFGEDYYLELQHHPNLADQQTVNNALIGLSQELDIPLVVTADSHYLCADDSEAQDVLLCVQTGAKVDDINRFSMKGEVFDLRNPQEIIDAFAHVPEAATNTVKIADKCNLEIPTGGMILPAFDLPEGATLQDYFNQELDKGLIRRFGLDIPEAVRTLADFEVSVISQMGYQSYFLIVADFVNWAKRQGILVGPGRGSAAGSMVSYALGITSIDPIKHGLLFERFLNPERVSMPDIDLDFADDRRGEVIEYVIQKYGRGRVAQIVTFGTMASRSAIRDVGRAIGMSYGEVDRIAKMVPPPQQGKYTPLSVHIQNVPELTGVYASSEQAKHLLDLAQKMEGTIRHASTHAAGVVISDKDLTHYTPLQYSPTGDQQLITQYSMYPVEAVGLLKMDFLGLKNLTIIKNSLRIIRKIHHLELDLDKLPFDDAKTFELLAAANTTGIFQLEGDGMRRYLKELKPTVFDDVVAMVAMYRPGPIEFVPDFIARKHGQKKIEYLHPKLEPILKSTYGIAVYQEQVMHIARELCGFTRGEADVLRKAMGKKIPKLLAEQKEKFINGAIANQVSDAAAQQLWHFVEPFGLYGFNRAHSVSYATISYWTAYLKAHFPNAFMAALMTSDQQDLDKIAKNIGECEHMGIKVLPPSVNRSFTGFAVVKETGDITFGLNAIKNVGQKVSDTIAEERQTNGVYQDLTDFVKRAGREVINKKTVESLVLAGALDEFGDRKIIFNNLDNILKYASGYYLRRDSTQEALFGETEVGGAETIQLQIGETATDREKLTWEREYLGTFVSQHPLKEIMPKLQGIVRPIRELSNLDDNQMGKVAGVVTRVQKVFTKNGDAMLFVNLEDLGGTIEVIVFPKVFEQTITIWERDKVVLITGKVNVKERAETQGDNIVMVAEPKIIVAEAVEVTDAYIGQLQKADTMLAPRTTVPISPLEQYDNEILIKLPKGFGNGQLQELKNILEQHPGDLNVTLELFTQGRWQTIKTSTKAGMTPALEQAVVKLTTGQLTN
ncbi:DNA polymerase III subunit alpha [candidate division Kazan bacterium RIFCSPHIGHO2_01_FULL_44_14]|uniref:DNA polymerase III subunit alpha n=1 Tax=candidate division Kazan bacterium RIFCSPLOWO2_01_FULL_45_19 TaxID=1798538 RepID=A0A1F4NQU1_UNCK3|nr:hypothetical protein [uncultured bacterium]AQS31069.1 hypothetical protein [uncultured bacterium]OGB73647.1 MAG: DNA polymerase III subunit alpha [candidate division Kazan bacterium RIFCSPLOWO2_01_FULL_45_19]OGB77892.1 MAG: DNA polymerase III subunit alpha [candidate division Kazan bacterium RIFCSPHIGHO2_01_FULL_44_14]